MRPVCAAHLVMSDQNEEYTEINLRDIECTTTVSQAALVTLVVQRDPYEYPLCYPSYEFWASTGASGASPSEAE